MNREIVTYINNIPVYKNALANLPYNPALKARSTTLKKAGNYPEVIFWQHVHRG